MAELEYPDPPLGDGVVTLRAWREEEAAVRVAWASDPEIVRWTGVPPGYLLEDARLHGATMEQVRRRGEAIHFAIAEAATDAVLGGCDIRLLPERGRGGELGYLLAEWARGRGLMHRALTLLIGWSFATLPITRVQALVDPRNLPSIRVLDRLGFRRDVVLHAHRRGPEGLEDRIVFSLVAREWAARRDST